MPSTLSLQSIRIEALDEIHNDLVTRGTGFFCRYQAKLYLVTNWHIVAGRNPITNCSKTGARPGTLKCKTFIAKPSSTPTPGQKHIPMATATADFTLQLLDSNGDPLWKEHPTYSQKVDVVAIKMAEEFDVEGLHAYDIEEELRRLESMAVMAKVFIIGYPLTRAQTNNMFPIYKGATIASEPGVYDDEPRIHLDSKTKPGMSGSPVVYEHTDDPKAVDGGIAFSDPRRTLVGVYAGRDGIADDEFTAELGRMYPIEDCLLPILQAP